MDLKVDSFRRLLCCKSGVMKALIGSSLESSDVEQTQLARGKAFESFSASFYFVARTFLLNKFLQT